jgi:hypothetical protein
MLRGIDCQQVIRKIAGKAFVEAKLIKVIEIIDSDRP